MNKVETQFSEKINGLSGYVTLGFFFVFFVFFGLILVVRDDGTGAGIGLNAPRRKS